MRLLFLTKLLFLVVMLWGCRLNSAGSQVIGLLVVVILCSQVYNYVGRWPALLVKSSVPFLLPSSGFYLSPNFGM